MIRRAGILLALAGCAPAFTAPPDHPALTPAEPAPAQVVVTEDGRLETREDPYAPRALRRAGHDVQATLLAPGVALVVEPAVGAPIYVSNVLAAALVRRFGGHLPADEAMAAPVAILWAEPQQPATVLASAASLALGYPLALLAIGLTARQRSELTQVLRRLIGAKGSPAPDTVELAKPEELPVRKSA